MQSVCFRDSAGNRAAAAHLIGLAVPAFARKVTVDAEVLKIHANRSCIRNCVYVLEQVQ